MDDLYVAARRVLLDALEALEPHLNAVTLVGAQALYPCTRVTPNSLYPRTPRMPI